MNHKYANIMTPLPLGRYILKNRIINSKSMPDVGDPADYPNEHQIEFADQPHQILMCIEEHQIHMHQVGEPLDAGLPEKDL